MKHKICKNCKKVFYKPSGYSYEQWYKKIFCSNNCSQDFRARDKRVLIICEVCGKTKIITLSKQKHGCKTCSKKCLYKFRSKKYKGEGNFFYGKHHTEKTKRHLSVIKLGISTEHNKKEKCHFWKGGVCEKNKTKRQNLMRTIKYKNWRRRVFNRDKYTCLHCGKTGGRLHADHIKSFSKYPKLIFSVKNGRTLCESCHKKTDTWGIH